MISITVMGNVFSQSVYRGKVNMADINKQSNIETSRETAAAKLKLHIKDQRYCRSVVAGNNVIQINLSIEVMNTGNVPLILFQSGHRIIEYSLSKTRDDALLGKYETKYFLHGTRDFLEDISARIDTSDPSEDFFKIVPSGESYWGEERLTIPIRFNENVNNTEELSDGEHFLQIGIATWPNIDMRPEKLRDRWKKHGYLFSNGLLSVPVSFNFYQSSLPEKCLR
jgi:hypothetical protein